MTKKKKSAAKVVLGKRVARSGASLSLATQGGRLFERVAAILKGAREGAVRSVNSHMVLAYWLIGREIVESLQGGDDRAEYGRTLIGNLSKRLTKRYGRGFSTTNLRYFRSFHQTYFERSPEIRHIPCGEFVEDAIRHKRSGVLGDLALAVEGRNTLKGFSPVLGWSHYRALMKVANASERAFYEIEAEKEKWSVEYLERQIHSLLFARLLKSRNKDGIMALARKGQEILGFTDAMKDPYVLDFLDIPDGAAVRETELESAIIGKLQDFLLEMGKGFAFVARQKRLAFEDEHFYVDLVFYHVILKCYILIDLKVGKLAHQDIGQMDSYVRLFDDQCATEGDNPTVGLILCAEKNEAIARYSVLRESKRIFAAKYVKHLPTEAELRRELMRERRFIERRLTPRTSSRS
jgi:predicted nuclease of restriction endonuclease-like (RecB) superfamily